ncbi:unnamed protein product [Cyprideis torosa]|uniref:Uncharacterized protein n=1 Tax=Cyprideis torosa TaxID=163714 RepID=A0A7R8WG76_9CRUS|nr:unnamed protein product [Cyprideis torosa]CAG0891461.1 unnamed protein product [Cyprideis torosa]
MSGLAAMRLIYGEITIQMEVFLARTKKTLFPYPKLIYGEITIQMEVFLARTKKTLFPYPNTVCSMPSDPNDTSFVPSESEMSVDEGDEEIIDQGRPSKYVIVDRKILLKLMAFSRCQKKPNCTYKVRDIQELRHHDGASYSLRVTCELNHTWTWCSSESAGNVKSLNVALTAATLVCGGTFSTMEEIARTAGIKFLSYRAMNRLAAAFVYPSVQHLYTQMQEDIFQQLREKEVVRLAADGQADSPGSNCKYMQVSFMDIDSNQIVHMELPQVSQAPNSVVLEKIGIQDGLKRLQSEGITVTDIVTDRSRTVGKMLREVFPEIRHHFDVWHVGKGLNKKLAKASLKKSNLESYHSLKIKYASKQTHYQFVGMQGRVQASILDHNENLHRLSKNPVVSYSKAMKRFELKDRKAQKTYNFRNSVVDIALNSACQSRETVDAMASRQTTEVRTKFKIPKCVAKISKPPREELEARYKMRKFHNDIQESP